LPAKKPRFAITLWFIDAVERDARTRRDADERKELCGDAFDEADETEEASPSEAVELIEEPKLAPGEKNIKEVKVSLEELTYSVYEISDFSCEDMLVAVLDSAPERVVLSSSDASFERIVIPMRRPIKSKKTEAKYKKKRKVLIVTVHV
jgi:hypothetical protein